MRQKELRIALVCYGGISLAVYMHGVTKEVWKLARASRAFHAHDEARPTGAEAVYVELLQHIAAQHGLKLRVLTDIVAGASAGGINGVFLAQAIHSGQSLEPLTALWLDRADVDALADPDAHLGKSLLKLAAVPVVHWILSRPGNLVSASVAPETRWEVRNKLSRFVRSRWFEAPFGGIGFSRVLAESLDAMAASPVEAPLLPPGHPLDLFVTATDFKGHMEAIRLHSPPLVEESEHRLSIGFRSPVPDGPGQPLAPTLDLVFAARATASFPGAFPALQPGEIDRLAAERGQPWDSRAAFLSRIMPAHQQRGDLDAVSLIDGSVLVNAPFAEAMTVLRDRPAQREVDRRFVYIDPRPQQVGGVTRGDPRPPGFFSVIFGSLSSIPREQPIRDNLELLERQSREMTRLNALVEAMRGEVEAVVEKTFGRTLFFDHPTVSRLAGWRARAQVAAAEHAGLAWHGYAQLKFTTVLDALARDIALAAPGLGPNAIDAVYDRLARHLAVDSMAKGAVSLGGWFERDLPPVVRFLRDHDLAYRIRRLRLLARRLAETPDEEADVDRPACEAARDEVYRALALYFDREALAALGTEFPGLAANVMADPGAVVDAIASRRQLETTDTVVDAMLAQAFAAMPPPLRRRALLTYLGFPFYDTLTLPLLRGEGLTEYDPVKVDRISPDDAPSIRSGGAAATLRGVEFYNFGAFFSRTYRENDYLWGRLHGAERMIDLVASAVPGGLAEGELRKAKRALFLAVLDEEEPRLRADAGLVSGIREEVLRKL
ncbi:MAG: patatin-like protein [Sphingomonadales bacterium]|nr:patatin-like protein [Sphingomonadales bacterium]